MRGLFLCAGKYQTGFTIFAPLGMQTSHQTGDTRIRRFSFYGWAAIPAALGSASQISNSRSHMCCAPASLRSPPAASRPLGVCFHRAYFSLGNGLWYLGVRQFQTVRRFRSPTFLNFPKGTQDDK